MDHVKSSNFTESDRRKVLDNFLSNDEVLYFIYLLLFPHSVLNQEEETEKQNRVLQVEVSPLEQARNAEEQ